jgi:hypothetical protein
MNWEPIVKGWLLKRSPIEQDILFNLYENSFPDAYTYVMQALEPKMKVKFYQLIKKNLFIYV